MAHDFESAARHYFEERFPEASDLEKQRYLQDWLQKLTSTAPIIEELEKTLGPLAGKNILDIGSGSGGLALGLSRTGAHVTGIDIEPALSDIARARVENEPNRPDFVLYDGRHMPFEDNVFDLAVCCSVFEHMDDPGAVLTEIERVLKPGGYFYLTFPNKWVLKETHSHVYFVSYLPYPLADALVRLLGRSPLKYLNLHFYSYGGFKRILKRSTHNLEVLPPKFQSGIRGWIKRALWRLGKHYTCLTTHIILYLQKRPGTGETSV